MSDVSTVSAETFLDFNSNTAIFKVEKKTKKKGGLFAKLVHSSSEEEKAFKKNKKLQKKEIKEAKFRNTAETLTELQQRLEAYNLKKEEELERFPGAGKREEKDDKKEKKKVHKYSGLTTTLVKELRAGTSIGNRF